MKSRMRLIVFCAVLFCGCGIDYSEEISETGDIFPAEVNMFESETGTENDLQIQLEKGYNLPLDEGEELDLQTQMEGVFAIIGSSLSEYYDNTKCETEIPDEELAKILNRLSENGYIVKSNYVYSNLENWELLESFLQNAKNGKTGEVTIFEVSLYGAIIESKYTSTDGKLYVVCDRFSFNSDGEFVQNYCSKARIKSWRYTDTGWFCYELCVPEYPEVSEVVDGSVLLRVKPISDENRIASEKYVLGLGYQGNNILCTSWNAETIEELDFTGIYEYLYKMEYGEDFKFAENQIGIPKDEFEYLIMKYLPVSVEQIRESTTLCEEYDAYLWARLGGNYAPNRFGHAYPEVEKIRQNDDGTITLTVNAVCESLNNEAIITHELTIKESDDGRFMYMKNDILNNGEQCIPGYQYRMR